MMAASRQPLVVLLAGDELTRSITTSCLEMSGYEVLGARTAGEVESLLLAQTGRAPRRRAGDRCRRARHGGRPLARRRGPLSRPAVGVVYTARSLRQLDAEALEPGSLRLRTPYHGHQLVALVAELLAPAVDRTDSTARRPEFAGIGSRRQGRRHKFGYAPRSGSVSARGPAPAADVPPRIVEVPVARFLRGCRSRPERETR